MLGFDLLLETKGRFYIQEGSVSPAFPMFTKSVSVIDSDLSVVNLIMQPCFGYGYYKSERL